MDQKILRNIANNESKIIGAFNLGIKKLVRLTNNLVPHNDELKLLNIGAARLNSHIGDMAIKKIGPELYIYRNEILNQDFQFLTEINYQKQLNEYNNNDIDVNSYIVLIRTLILTYNECNGEDRNDIHKLISELLRQYILYVIHCKKYHK